MNYINAKKTIGEWIDRHRADENITDCVDCIVDGKEGCISFLKAGLYSTIKATLCVDGTEISMFYPANPNLPFDMAKLICNGGYPEK